MWRLKNCVKTLHYRHSTRVPHRSQLLQRLISSYTLLVLVISKCSRVDNVQFTWRRHLANIADNDGNKKHANWQQCVDRWTVCRVAQIAVTHVSTIWRCSTGNCRKTSSTFAPRLTTRHRFLQNTVNKHVSSRSSGEVLHVGRRRVDYMYTVLSVM